MVANLSDLTDQKGRGGRQREVGVAVRGPVVTEMLCASTVSMPISWL